jgi:ankyrin repeat protein
MIVSNDMTSSSSGIDDNNGSSHDESNKPVPLPLDESFLNQLELLLNTNDERLISILNQRGYHITYTPDDVYHFAREGDIVNLRSALSVKSNTTDWKWEQLHPNASRQFVALHVAAKNGHLDCVWALLDVGVDINIRGKRSSSSNNANEYNLATPLHLAAQEGHKLVVALLIEKGANMNIGCSDRLVYIMGDFKAIDVAAVNKHTEVVKLLYNHGANASRTLDFAAIGGSLDCINLLLDEGCVVNPGDSPHHATSLELVVPNQ